MSSSGGACPGVANGIMEFPPMLTGTQWMIPATSFERYMLRWEAPRGDYISRQAAAYPGDLNKELAHKCVQAAIRARKRRIENVAMVRTGYWSNTLIRQSLVKGQQANPRAKIAETDRTRVQMLVPLRGEQQQPIPPIEDEVLHRRLVGCLEVGRKDSRT